MAYCATGLDTVAFSSNYRLEYVFCGQLMGAVSGKEGPDDAEQCWFQPR